LSKAREELLQVVTPEPVKTRVLREVSQRGGVVTKDDLRNIALEMGMDPRGLGGFYSHQGRSLRSLSDRRVTITEEGYRELEKASWRPADAAHEEKRLLRALQREPVELPGTPLSQLVVEERQRE
jgi:hypothetical protein